MSKKIEFGARPSAKPALPADPDTWIAKRTPEPGAEEETKIKRLTIDISSTLHRKIKTQCAARGTKIVDEVRELLEQKYGNG